MYIFSVRFFNLLLLIKKIRKLFILELSMLFRICLIFMFGSQNLVKQKFRLRYFLY